MCFSLDGKPLQSYKILDCRYWHFNMRENKFYKLLQRRIANTSISASTARSMSKGTVEKASEFLGKLELKQFKKRSKFAFEAVLNETTNALMESLPKGERNKWGNSRKFVNIFYGEWYTIVTSVRDIVFINWSLGLKCLWTAMWQKD